VIHVYTSCHPTDGTTVLAGDPQGSLRVFEEGIDILVQEFTHLAQEREDIVGVVGVYVVRDPQKILEIILAPYRGHGQ
jgi:hypothetical protein